MIGRDFLAPVHTEVQSILASNLLNSGNIAFDSDERIEGSLLRRPIEHIDKRPISKTNAFREDNSLALKALQGLQIEPVGKIIEQPLSLRRSNDKMV